MSAGMPFSTRDMAATTAVIISIERVSSTSSHPIPESAATVDMYARVLFSHEGA